MVVAADYIAEGREALFDALDFDAIWEGVAEMLEFLIGCCCWDEETIFVSLSELVLLDRGFFFFSLELKLGGGVGAEAGVLGDRESLLPDR